MTERTTALDNKIAAKEESNHTATITTFDTDGIGMILDLCNKNGVCVGHFVIRPKDYQENIALELYTADWSVRPWTICKDIL